MNKIKKIVGISMILLPVLAIAVFLVVALIKAFIQDWKTMILMIGFFIVFIVFIYGWFSLSDKLIDY